MLQCYSERDASAHALPEREGVNGWMDGGMKGWSGDGVLWRGGPPY